MIWCDELHALSQRVLSEAKRGRFQRSNGDIVSLFERSFALIQGFWSLLDSNPIAVVPFLPVARVLETLSCHTNIVCPFMQHFLLHCDSLTHHRKQLSNVNSMIMNATVSAASIVVMFYPFKPADVMKEAAARDGLGFSKAVTLRSYTIPSIVESYEEEIIDSLITFLNPLSVPVVLLENSRNSSTSGRGSGGSKPPSILQVIDAIAPIQEKDEPSSASKRRQGKRGGGNTGAIGEVISDSSIISSGGMSLSELLMPLIQKAAEEATGSVSDGTNFIRALLGELVNQGGGVDEWAARGLINSGDAEQLGSNTSSVPAEQQTTKPTQQFDSEQDAIDAAIAASMVDTGSAAAACAEENDGLGDATRDEREQISMVMDIAPILGSPGVALAALRYYNGDLEALLVDATSDNMPPHLLAAASAPTKTTTSSKAPAYEGAAAASSSSAGPSAASSGPSQTVTTTKKEGYLNMHAFLFSHWNAYQNDAAEDGDEDEEHDDDEEEDGGWEAMATTGAGGGRQVSDNLFSSPNDTDMHAITQMLVDQLLYEDERDDGQDYEAEAIIPARNANHRAGGAARSGRSKYGNDDDDEPLYNNHSHTVVMGKAGGGGSAAASGGPATQPRYTTKNKYDSANKRKAEEKKNKTTEEKKEERPTRSAPKSKTGGKQHDRKGGKSSF